MPLADYVRKGGVPYALRIAESGVSLPELMVPLPKGGGAVNRHALDHILSVLNTGEPSLPLAAIHEARAPINIEVLKRVVALTDKIGECLEMPPWRTAGSSLYHCLMSVKQAGIPLNVEVLDHLLSVAEKTPKENLATLFGSDIQGVD